MSTDQIRDYLELLTGIYLEKEDDFASGASIAKGHVIQMLDDIDTDGREGDAPILMLRQEIEEELTTLDSDDQPTSPTTLSERWLYSEVVKYLTPNQEPKDLPQP